MSIEKGKVFVGGFTTEFTEDELNELFSVCGEIESVTIFHKRITFAHIIFKDKASCQKAVDLYEMKQIKTITMRVGIMKMTKEKEDVIEENTFGSVKISVVLVRPMHEHNIGAVARLSANYGVQKLIIVNSQCELGEESLKVSRHGKKYIEEVIKCNDIKEVRNYCSLLIGFTARESTGSKGVRLLQTLSQTGEMLQTLTGEVALVFGNESTGLTTDECDGCDVLNKIDIQSHYPILNLSHAVGIALNQLHLVLRDNEVPDNCKDSISSEKDKLLALWKEMLLKSMNEKRETGAVDAMKKMLGRVVLTETEAKVLQRTFKAILHAVEDQKEQNNSNEETTC
ncbi:RNA methyltransferase [Entamoeba marina]